MLEHKLHCNEREQKYFISARSDAKWYEYFMGILISFQRVASTIRRKRVESIACSAVSTNNFWRSSTYITLWKGASSSSKEEKLHVTYIYETYHNIIIPHIIAARRKKEKEFDNFAQREFCFLAYSFTLIIAGLAAMLVWRAA